MSAFSRVTANNKLAFKKHHVYEVSTSLVDARHIANDFNSANAYKYRAKVSTVGFSGIRPYDPIYLDGLPNGLSGYWTVISVRHIFGGTPLSYMLDIEVGTDIIGDTNPDASKATLLRDVQGELSGQVIITPDPVLDTTYEQINSTPLVPVKKYPATRKTVAKATAIPSTVHPKFYNINTPTPPSAKRSVAWQPTGNSGRVGR